MKEKLSWDKNMREYYFKGYYYSILSKILPSIILRTYLFEDSCTDLFAISEIAVKQWRNICSFMRYKIYRQEFEHEPVEKKLLQVLEVEKKISSSFGLYMQGGVTS